MPKYKLVPVGAHYEAVVDAQNYPYVSQFRWFAIPSGGRAKPMSPVATRHVKTPQGTRTISMHREILGMADDDRRQVHHINGDNLDNRKANLRIHEAQVKSPPVVSELKPPPGPCIRVGGNRPRRQGEPSIIRWARVDAEDLASLSQYLWSPIGRRSGRVIAIRRERQPDGSYATLQMHREIMGLKAGDPRQVDHRNGDPMDNRRSNLRVLTAAQNAENRPNGVHLRRSKFGGQKQRTSQHRGVIYEPKYRLPWCVVLRFPTEEEAAAARQDWEREYMPYADPAYDGPE